MSACKCEESKKPIHPPPGSNQRPRAWVVVRRNWNASAFNGYKVQYTDYSSVECCACGARWRTKAKFVDKLPDGKL